ncbi:MAG TPA: tRNA (N(6)-L-threonylcarbamoyladenosine(37)-C(2))-methylthiotransferase MtaB [Terriglobia bacterium]|jgi:threonylcarbamoyladenosine tRNA methylthiotransferase MtaB|nr:tRNA (N(6)-L-threonylcarbamoyladenosine(37)-C(2))-methylthiotransferase MtaB [Terriglobia bacterium]
MSTFHIINFGCRASHADGAAIKSQLMAKGLTEAGLDESELAVLNTCTVTAAADAEVRQVIRRIHRSNPRCKILVTGCYAQRAPDELTGLPGVAWVIGNSHKHALVNILADNSGSRSESDNMQPLDGREPVEELPPDSEAPAVGPLVLVGEVGDTFHHAPVFADDRTRPTLKVQDGCDARCSFCVIPYVRGASRSMHPDQVINQVRELERSGYQEIVLSGINLGGYGRDLGRCINFLGLVERILSETSIPRLRISSIEPMDVSRELIDRVATEPRMAQHFHVPLQSGSDRVLRLMNRRYWTTQYADRILAIRERMPDCGIGADVMTGFPGETDADHRESLRFIESLPFTYLHIFPYSARPGTPAAARAEQVDGRRIHERVREMKSLIAAKRSRFLHSQIGKKLSAVVLHKTEHGFPVALTSNYLQVSLPGASVPPNTLINVEIGRVDGGKPVGRAALQ